VWSSVLFNINITVFCFYLVRGATSYFSRCANLLGSLIVALFPNRTFSWHVYHQAWHMLNTFNIFNLWPCYFVYSINAWFSGSYPNYLWFGDTWSPVTLFKPSSGSQWDIPPPSKFAYSVFLLGGNLSRKLLSKHYFKCSLWWYANPVPPNIFLIVISPWLVASNSCRGRQ